MGLLRKAGVFTGSCPPSDVITTKYGKILGRRLIDTGDKQVDAYQGIPFAKPPVGDLRFRMPEAPDPWTETKVADGFGPRAMQKDFLPFAKWRMGACSEDCLTLNVFRPVWKSADSKGFPVMVYIHGGGFIFDCAKTQGDIGACKHLVTKDIIVVTIQYRLGFLGFWNCGDQELCPTNLGLWDQTFALKWVQENIAAFGGDPARVTIAGQSAGAASVDLLRLSPHSRDLFQQVIIMSGSSHCSFALQRNTEHKCRLKAERMGVNEHHDGEAYLKALRHLPASKFCVNMSPDNVHEDFELDIGPCYDGVFFPKSLEELREEAPPKPTIIGVCREEGAVFAPFEKNQRLTRVRHCIDLMYPESEFPTNCGQLRRSTLPLYLDVSKPPSKDDVFRALTKTIGDYIFTIGIQECVLESVNRHPETPLYFYTFDHFNPKSWGLLGLKMKHKAPTHSTELCYLFEIGVFADFEFTTNDRDMIEKTTTLWTNFIKYGDPNGNNSTATTDFPRWEPTTAANPQRHYVISIEHTGMEDVFQEGRIMEILRRRNHSLLRSDQ